VQCRNRDTIQSAVWSSDSNMLLLAAANTSLITTINFDRSSLALNTRVTLDVSPVTDGITHHFHTIISII
jgi:hypothetical protein